MFSEFTSEPFALVPKLFEGLRNASQRTLRFAALLCALFLVATAASAQTPTCTPTVNPNPVPRGTGTYTITANCSGAPIANGYSYTGTTLALGVSSAGPTFTASGQGAVTPGPNLITVSNTNGASGTVILNVLGQLACSPTATPQNPRPGDVVTLDGRCTEDGVALPPTAFTTGGYVESWTVPGIGNFTRGTSLVTFTVPTGAAGGTTYNASVIATNNNIPNSPTSSKASAVTITVQANAPPTASITAPANNATFTAPATISITANAADSDGTIQRVEFYNGATLLGTATAVPYAFNWTNVPAGNYALTARAFDNLGAQADSAVVNVSVTNATPTVAITAPANNSTFTAPATIPFTATASAPGTTITRVEYLVNGAVIGSAATPPFAFNWQNVAAGNYAVTPRVVPAAGASVSGTPITVVVNDPPASVAITSPNNGANFTAPATIPLTATAAAPGTSVARVEYLVNNAIIGQAIAAPYAFNWTGVPPGSYSITARVVPSVGAARGSVVSAPIVVTVGTPPAPSLACRVDSPPAINITQGTSLTAACTRNGAPITVTNLGANETISYQWRAIGASPVASSTTSVLSFPAGTFKRSGSYDYGVVATITNSLFAASSATAPEAIGTVKVERTVSSITVTTPVTQRKVVPGEKVSFAFVVRDSEGPVPDREVLWAIVGGNIKRAAAKATLGKACVAEDLPKPLPVFTNAQGEGTVRFIAGCATGGRDVLLTAGSVTEMVKLTGPDQLATKTVLLAGATLVVAEPGKATVVPVGVIDSAGGKVVSSTTTWSIDPATAGALSPTAVSDSEGVARSTLTLNAGVSKAELQVCIEGRPDTCVRIPVRNTVTAVAEPGNAILQPILRQAIEAPRVQINNIRNRLQQLRVEETAGTNVAGGGSERSGDGAAPKTSRFGVFVLGDVDLAKRQSSGGETTYKLRTKGVTVGADYRVDKNFVVGGAFGALRGDTTLQGGEQKTKGYSGSLFAQWLPTADLYTNAIINAGTNRIDNRRTSIGGDSLTGRGTTTQQGFQVEAGYALTKEGLRFTPFARYELIRAKLKPFEESGGMDALAISGQKVRSNTFGLGAVAEYAISTSSGVWIPNGRIEFLNEAQKQNAVFARLVNGTPILVPLSPELLDKNFGTWGLNLQWLTGPSGNLISSFIGYEQTFGKTGFKSERFTAGVKIPF
jgi:Autotransporter beta-domain/Bacterial Ig domain